MPPKVVFRNCLALILMSVSLLSMAQEGCKEIGASIVVNQPDTERKGSVQILLTQPHDQVMISLIGPSGYFKHDIQGDFVGELSSVGGYVIVLTGRKENQNFCIEKLDFTIQ